MEHDDFDQIIKQLQKKINEDEEKIFSDIVINEYRNPIYFGGLKQPHAIGQIKGPCGDTMKFNLIIEKGIIKDASFWTDGCGASIASGNMCIKMIKGKSIDVAIRITSEQLLDRLHGLPKGHKHCATLAVNTLHLTINNYQIKKNIKGNNDENHNSI